MKKSEAINMILDALTLDTTVKEMNTMISLIDFLEENHIMVPACSKKGKMEWDPEDVNPNSPA